MLGFSAIACLNCSVIEQAIESTCAPFKACLMQQSGTLQFDQAITATLDPLDYFALRLFKNNQKRGKKKRTLSFSAFRKNFKNPLPSNMPQGHSLKD